MNEDYRPRFSFEITEEQRNRADKLITQYGLRKAIFGRLLDNVLDIVEEFGGMGIGALMSEDSNAVEVLLSMRKEKKDG